MRCSLLTLSTYLDGELAPERAGELEAHLVACARCTDGLGFLREEQEHIRGLAGVTASAGAATELLSTVGITLAPEEEAAREPGFLLELAQSRDAAAAAHADDSENGAVVELSGSAAAPAANGTAAADADHAHGAQRAAEFEDYEEADAGILEASPPAPPSWSSRYTPAMHARISALRPAEPEQVIPMPEAAHSEVGAPETADAEAEVSDETPASEGWLFDTPVEEAEARATPVVGEHAAETLAAETVVPEPDVPEPVAAEPEVPDEPVPETPPESVRPAPQPERTEAPAAATAAPVQAPRPASWVDRARDAVALRWALMRGASPTDDNIDDETIQIVSGAGAPSHPRRQQHRPVTEAKMPAPVEAFEKPRAPQEPLASAPTPAATAQTAGPVVVPETPALHAEAGAGRHVRALHGDKRGWRRPRLPTKRPATLPGPMTDRRLWVFGGSVAILALIGLLLGKTTSVPSQNTAGTPPHPSAISQPTAPALASAAPSVAPSAVASPQPTPKPTPTPTPAAPNPTKLTGAQNLGAGATGVSVQDLRYGSHPNDFRIVFDLSGSGSPATTVGFGNATTLYVEFSGVTGSSSITQPSSGQEVTAVNLLQPSPMAGKTVYEITLANPATLSTIYLQSPLRLVIDLGS